MKRQRNKEKKREEELKTKKKQGTEELKREQRTEEDRWMVADRVEGSETQIVFSLKLVCFVA